MSTSTETPCESARAKLEQIERELRKLPDFQLYLIAKSRKDRARMSRVLMEIPNFRLWRSLRSSVTRTRRGQLGIHLHSVESVANLPHDPSR
jgi:hypothetical protein